MTLEVEVEHRLGAFKLDARFSSKGRLTALFGQSGSGKTSLVNVIGGLIRPKRGRVVVDGTVLLDTEAGVFLPKHRRRIGYVFQEARLFPHLTVRQNLLFGRWFASGRERVATDDDMVIDLLGIGHLLARRPSALSGGEKQRVAIGRAIFAHPRLLLMDEPLASLDEDRKDEILPYIERLRDEAGVPIVYVSHSVAEVARLATTLVVLAEGQVAAVGPTGTIMARLDVSSLSGGAEGGVVLDAQVESHDECFGLTTLRTGAGDLLVPRVATPIGARMRARIRSRDVMVSLTRPDGLSALNMLPGTVVEVGPARDDGGTTIGVRLNCSGETLVARLTRKSVNDLALEPGQAVFAVVKSVSFT